MKTWNAAGSLRLSREDGDKSESDSIANQEKLIEQYVQAHPELNLVRCYRDDGYTGTNFDRPGFRAMMHDIEAGEINCVIVKDLSRFGRDYIEVGRYLERVFPALGVRFIAISDGIDSERGRYDMMLPLRNVINGQYAQDIADKVRATFKSKQTRGEFIGAFTSYGYRKDPENHNRLLIDPDAAQVVRRIFDLFEAGTGKIRIAKILNAEGVPSPSEYKRLLGQNYRNGQKLEKTTYWTYATIHRMLGNQMYAGHMEQGRNVRLGMHSKAKHLERSEWIVVRNTHEAIIGPDQWERVQTLLRARGREVSFTQNLSPLAGFLRCGDCGRAMAKNTSAGGVYYCCGSYRQYGPSACSKHSIAYKTLEQIILSDLNRVIESVRDLQRLVEESDTPKRDTKAEESKLSAQLARVRRLKRSSYEHFSDGLIGREDYIRYRDDYERQEQELAAQIAQIEQTGPEELLRSPWVQSLLSMGRLTQLDRITVAETIREIRIFEGGRIELYYKFANHLDALRSCA